MSDWAENWIMQPPYDVQRLGKKNFGPIGSHPGGHLKSSVAKMGKGSFWPMPEIPNRYHDISELLVIDDPFPIFWIG